ncbi:hypothetical protein D3C77_566340 [compost metagenome]
MIISAAVRSWLSSTSTASICSRNTGCRLKGIGFDTASSITVSMFHVETVSFLLTFACFFTRSLSCSLCRCSSSPLACSFSCPSSCCFPISFHEFFEIVSSIPSRRSASSLVVPKLSAKTTYRSSLISGIQPADSSFSCSSYPLQPPTAS